MRPEDVTDLENTLESAISEASEASEALDSLVDSDDLPESLRELAIDAADQLIRSAIDCLEASRTLNSYDGCTMIANLQILLGEGGWLARETTLADLKKRITNPDDDDDELEAEEG